MLASFYGTAKAEILAIPHIITVKKVWLVLVGDEGRSARVCIGSNHATLEIRGLATTVYVDGIQRG